MCEALLPANTLCIAGNATLGSACAPQEKGEAVPRGGGSGGGGGCEGGGPAGRARKESGRDGKQRGVGGGPITSRPSPDDGPRMYRIVGTSSPLNEARDGRKFHFNRAFVFRNGAHMAKTRNIATFLARRYGRLPSPTCSRCRLCSPFAPSGQAPGWPAKEKDLRFVIVPVGRTREDSWRATATAATKTVCSLGRSPLPARPPWNGKKHLLSENALSSVLHSFVRFLSHSSLSLSCSGRPLCARGLMAKTHRRRRCRPNEQPGGREGAEERSEVS